jgi:hypothetical protein
LEDPFAEELAAGVGELVSDEAEGDSEEYVGRIGESRWHLPDQDVASDAPPSPPRIAIRMIPTMVNCL